ncbi:MAG: hypothetical protein M0R74_09495 [Dehalococcoidia bacterium]|nr:hypothetical protein [Dehalococcoidia bacterium]
MLFDLIFLGLFMVGWLACAYVPWLAVSVATRGNAGMMLLPICLFTGVVGALTVPVLGFEGAGGLKASFLVAFAASGAILAVARFAHQPGTTREGLESGEWRQGEDSNQR